MTNKPIQKGTTVGHRITVDTLTGEEDVDFMLPNIEELDLEKPLKPVHPILDIDSDKIRQHEQIYRAIETILVEAKLDAIFYGTGGPTWSQSNGDELQPAIVVMVACQKFSVMIVDYDIIVVRQPDVVSYWHQDWCEKNREFAVPLQEPDSLEQLVTYFRSL